MPFNMKLNLGEEFKMIIIIITVLIVALSVFILVREIRKMIKGRCCESCKHCSVKDQCESKKSD